MRWYGWVMRLALFCAVWPKVALAANFWSGFSPHAHFAGEFVGNFAGGLARGGTGTAYFDGGLDWDSTAAGAYPGGKFVLRYLAVDTGEPDQLYVGDVQGVSNLTTDYNISRLYKLYYRQSLGPVTARLGLLNANDYFDTVGTASYLLCPSYGIFPVWSSNLPGSSTYPFSSLGAMVALGGDHHLLEADVFGADAMHPYRQPFTHGALMLLQYTQAGKLGAGDYTIKLGAFRNRQNAQLAPRLGPQTSGFFGAMEYRFDALGLNWGAFLVGGGAPKPVNAVPWYAGAGLRVKNWFPNHPDDVLSAGASRVSLRGLPHAETNYEVTGIFALGPGVKLQPDLQVIVHPGGQLPTALVGILRVDIDLVQWAKSQGVAL